MGAQVLRDEMVGIEVWGGSEGPGVIGTFPDFF